MALRGACCFRAQAKGELNKAGQLFRRALDVFERTLGRHHPRTVRSMHAGMQACGFLVHQAPYQKGSGPASVDCVVTHAGMQACTCTHTHLVMCYWRPPVPEQVYNMCPQ